MSRPRIVALCYHAVSDDWPAQMAVTPARFEEQLRSLRDRGYQGATFTEAVLSPPHRRTLAVTFDDGFRSVLEQAFPVLDRLGLPATLFVPTDLVGSGRPMSWPGLGDWLAGAHAAELLPLDWDELRGLASAGWEIASHTRTHPRLTTLGDEELREQLTASRTRLEDELGTTCRSLAYPFGEADERVVAAAREAGYDAAGGLPTSFRHASALTWPRTGIWRDDGSLTFRIKVAGPVLALQRTSAFSALDYPRRALKRLLRPHRTGRPWLDG